MSKLLEGLKVSKNDRIQARIEPELKQAAETIFSQLGITSGEAIRMFYAQVKMRGGIPFEVAIPNQDTLDAMKEANQLEPLEEYASFGDLRKELGV